MEDDCSVMETLSNSLLLRATLIFNLFTSLIALPMILFASYSLACARVSKLFHINVIIIFQMHLFGFAIHCFSRIVLHSLDLYNYAFLSYCEMIPSTWRCFVFRLLYVTGLWIVSASTVPLVIERYIATKKSSSYEHTGCTLGLFMISLQLLLAVIPTFSTFINFNFQEGAYHYCMAIKPSSFVSNSEKMSAINLVVQIVARLIYQYLFKMNENLRRKQLTSSLSNRYSLEQNLKSMRTLKLFADLQCAFMIIHMSLFIFLLQFGTEIAKPTYISFVELPNILIVLIFFFVIKPSDALVTCNGTELSAHSNSEVGLMTDKRCTHVFGDIVLANLRHGKRLPMYWSIRELRGSLIIQNTTNLGDSVNFQNLRSILALDKPAIIIRNNRRLKLAIGARLSHVYNLHRITYMFMNNWPAMMSQSQHYTLYNAVVANEPVFWTDNFFQTEICNEDGYMIWSMLFSTLCLVTAILLVLFAFYGRSSTQKVKI